MGPHFCRRCGFFCIFFLEEKIGSKIFFMDSSSKSKCPKCETPYGKRDLFCKKCGTRLRNSLDHKKQLRQFEIDVVALFQALNEFRIWIDKNEKLNVPFMKSYKEKMDGEVSSLIKKFDENYRKTEEKFSPFFNLMTETFSALNRPIAFMETRLRPSIGMGVFLERWMLINTVESYLKECCKDADYYLDMLKEKIKYIKREKG